MKRFKQKAGALALLYVLSPMASADIIGVGDAALLVKAVEQLKQLQDQYELLKNTYSNSKSQLDGINRLKDFNSGSYGFGSLENGMDELRNWQSSADNWDDALKNISGGNKERYAELVRAYEAAHPTISEAEYSKGASPERLAQYRQNKAVNRAASVETTYAFNEVNKHLKSIHTLSSQIEKAPNTKSAVDLNSRLIAELAYIEVLNLKLQTLISQQLAQSGANELADESEMIRFNTLADSAGEKR